MATHASNGWRGRCWPAPESDPMCSRIGFQVVEEGGMDVTPSRLRDDLVNGRLRVWGYRVRSWRVRLLRMFHSGVR